MFLLNKTIKYIFVLCGCIVSLQAIAEPAIYRIVTSPDYARPEKIRVYVDGKLRQNQAKTENALFSIAIDAGKHRVEVVRVFDDKKEYYGAAQVAVKEGQHEDVFISLKLRSVQSNHSNQGKVNVPTNASTTIRKKPKGKLVFPEMIPIKAGSFAMGCQNAIICSKDETPVHTVALKSFLLSKTEVTFEQWDACAMEGTCRVVEKDQGWGRAKRPVINVSWTDAQQYIDWLSKRKQKKYRLPTESEWEYAARAGAKSPFSTGVCINTQQANFNGTFNDSFAVNCKNSAKKKQYRKQTQVVGYFPANAFGLQDMHGNVWEWVQDCYRNSYKKKGKGGGCRLRVLRGGAWHSPMSNLRSSYRFRYQQDTRSFDVGFRVASDK